jgi:hypothetical protein
LKPAVYSLQFKNETILREDQDEEVAFVYQFLDRNGKGLDRVKSMRVGIFSK